MKYLYYFYSCFNPVFMGGLLDDAIENAKNTENEVLFTYCGGLNKMCLFNKNGSKSLCKFCSYCTKKTIESFNIKAEPLTKYLSDSSHEDLHYNNLSDLRKLEYRNVQIGLGIMSSFISGTRNLNPKMTVQSKKYFDTHVYQMVSMVDSIYNLIEIYKPDVIYSFNGRYEEVRAIYDITQELEIKCFLGEGIRRNGLWLKLKFEDHLPHDIKYLTYRRNYCWEHYDMEEEEKVQLGESFYIKRREGVYTNDKIYVKNQKSGNTPVIDKSKINIAIFNSSEDEFAAVGGAWDALKFFPTQYDGIIYLLENSPSNIHYYLRIHPNLKNIKYKYHTDLLDLYKKYSNVTVIPGDSDVSTYSLMEQMDKIVCFGSTMGIESVYWKKATINLGPATYSYDNICYEPTDLEDLKRLLESDLTPLFNDSIFKFGAYALNQKPLVIPDYNINYQPTRRRIGRWEYWTVPFISFFYGKSITNLIIAIGRAIFGYKIFNRFVIPIEEE